MAFKKFAEFISEQHKAKLPAKTEKPLGKGSKLPSAYHAKGAKADRGLVTADDDRGTPLGEKGIPNMTHKNAMPLGVKPAGAPKSLKHSKGKMPKALKNEAFLHATSNMSDAQFAASLLESNGIHKPKIHDLYGKKYTPEPAETMKYVVGLAMQNETLMRRLVLEMKRSGGFSKLVAELFNHNETFAVLAETAAGNSRISRKLSEAVAEPRGGGGSPAGPSGATAGNGPIIKNGGGNGGGMAPPLPPSEGEENPSDDANLLDDSEEDDNMDDDDHDDEDSDDDEDNDDEDGDGDDDDDDGDDDEKHTHIHIHNHHHNKKKHKKVLDLKPQADNDGGEMGGEMGGDMNAGQGSAPPPIGI
jgi:hypothetical protein